MSTPKDRRLSKIRPLPDPTKSQPSSPSSARAPRPLPEPGAPPPSLPSPAPATPVTFYGNTTPRRDPPPLPSRPVAPPPPPSPTDLGSKTTVYIPPEADTSSSSPFRSPVLVPDSPPTEPPATLLRPVTDVDWGTKPGASTWTNNWVDTEMASGGWDIPKDNDDWAMSSAANWSKSGWGNPLPVNITGRDEAEERDWWDKAAREAFGRPGSGLLPTGAIEVLTEHAGPLYMVHPRVPDPAELSKGQIPAPPESFEPPTEAELRASLPHANAFFSPQNFGWMVVMWKESDQLPPLLADAKVVCPLPEAERRKRNKLCGPDGPNLAHHFHIVDRQIDGSKLDPPCVYASPNSADAEPLSALICCQCPLWGVFSGRIDCVIPHTVLRALTEERAQAPGIGENPRTAVLMAVTTIHIVIQNRLWRNETRSIPFDATSALFKKIGWSPIVQQVFESIGFVMGPNNGRASLTSPTIDLISPEGKALKTRLLRAHVEVAAWLQNYRKKHGFTASEQKHVLTTTVEEVLYDLQLRMGADVASMSRDVPNFVRGVPDTAYSTLGLTPTSATFDMMAFAYLAQQRCYPEGVPDQFNCLVQYVAAAQQFGEQVPDWLQQLCLDEREPPRERFTTEDLRQATHTLGFGEHGPLGVLYEDADDPFVTNAVTHAFEQASANGKSTREIGEAYRIVALARGNRQMVEDYRTMAARGWMSLDEAYRMLGATKDVDDAMLITVATLQMSDSPFDAEKVKEAILFIAQARDSLRLKKFLETGQDPGDIVAPVPADLPRGLNQLGNTCYLNSLLQYFYTIKDLREAVLQLSQSDTKVLDDADAKLTEDNLKKIRVGGRNITRREIMRSRKFVKHLGDLFFNLEYAENPAVTPELELAKLALVMSKDEEDDDTDRPQTDGSNGSADTDATLVEDGAMRMSPRGGSPLSPGSVLGKRTREAGANQPKDGDIVMAPAEPAPAPTALAKRKATEVDSGMMFGRQHDVSECMDNCMFQIETALLRFDELSGSSSDISDKTSVVKSLFYGKSRQKISSMDTSNRSRSSLHEKEDIFSHLPVQVSDEGYDIYDGISTYFDDVVEFEGHRAQMEISLVDLPPVLQIQLQRVQFDRDTMQAYKNNAYVHFEETIRMDRFLDRADSTKKARAKVIQSELNTCRERIQNLTKGKQAAPGEVLPYVANFLSRDNGIVFDSVTPEFLDRLKAEVTFVADELALLRVQATELKTKLEAVWAGSAEVEYELTSVFIHRGTSPTFGHYFFYARDLPRHPDRWFKYNDAEVTQVPREEVFANTSDQTANPYLLVYAKKDSGIMDAVKRFDPAMLEEMAG